MARSTPARPVGRLTGLWRYPVKSMAAEPLDEVDVSWYGLVGDRRWAFVRDGMPGSGFPWLTLRQRGDLNRYIPSFVDPARPDGSDTVVRTPSGETLDVTDAALAKKIAPEGAHILRQNRGIFDTFPLSLITTRTIRSLGESVGASLETERFRPNFLVEAEGDAPFPEDDWVGATLRIGGLRFRIDKRDGRCVVITIDPATGERNPAILQAVTSERQGCLGVYGTPVEPGRVRVGDPVRLEP